MCIRDRKIDWVKSAAGARWPDIELEIAAYFTVVTGDSDDGTTLANMAARFGLAPDEFADHPHALIGSVGSIVDQLVERRDRYGISYVTFGAAAMESVAPIVARLAGS